MARMAGYNQSYEWGTVEAFYAPQAHYIIKSSVADFDVKFSPQMVHKLPLKSINRVSKSTVNDRTNKSFNTDLGRPSQHIFDTKRLLIQNISEFLVHQMCFGVLLLWHF